MEEEILLKPYALETELTGYMPIPRQLLDMDLPSTAAPTGSWAPACAISASAIPCPLTSSRVF